MYTLGRVQRALSLKRLAFTDFLIQYNFEKASLLAEIKSKALYPQRHRQDKSELFIEKLVGYFHTSQSVNLVLLISPE